MRPDSRRGFRGDLWRVARLLTRRNQGHAARRGDLRTTILAARESRCPGASRVNAKRVWISGLGPGRVKTFFILQNYTRPGVIHATRASEDIFAVSSLESIRAHPRAALSDLNGHTARTAVRAPQARTAARSGLTPTMFITRVRL